MNLVGFVMRATHTRDNSPFTEERPGEYLDALEVNRSWLNTQPSKTFNDELRKTMLRQLHQRDKPVNTTTITLAFEYLSDPVNRMLYWSLGTTVMTALPTLTPAILKEIEFTQIAASAQAANLRNRQFNVLDALGQAVKGLRVADDLSLSATVLKQTVDLHEQRPAIFTLDVITHHNRALLEAIKRFTAIQNLAALTIPNV